MADQLSARQLIPHARQLILPPPRWSPGGVLWRNYRAEGRGDSPADG